MIMMAKKVSWYNYMDIKFSFWINGCHHGMGWGIQLFWQLEARNGQGHVSMRQFKMQGSQTCRKSYLACISELLTCKRSFYSRLMVFKFHQFALAWKITMTKEWLNIFVSYGTYRGRFHWAIRWEFLHCQNFAFILLQFVLPSEVYWTTRILCLS